MHVTDLVATWRTRYWQVWSGLYYRVALRRFGTLSSIRRPILLTGGRWIEIGSRTSIRDGARLEVFQRPGEPEPSLVIGDHVMIEQNAHIVCSSGVTIESYVSIAPRCSIVDVTHPLPDGRDVSVGAMAVEGQAPVRIGTGAMLGVGCVVLPGVTIGEHSVIGANSVVTRDIPPGVIAAGNPARVLREVSTS